MVRTVPKKALLLAVAAAVVVMLVYYSRKQQHGATAVGPATAAARRRAPPPSAPSVSTPRQREEGAGGGPRHSFDQEASWGKANASRCEADLSRTQADIETVDVYPTLNFDADWIEQREYWNDKMQRRYERRRQETWSKVPLRVFVMPHSHNDPGWLKTVEGYFNGATRQILDNIVDKLTKYKEMTFIWTEIAFLSMWYETAHDARKANLQHLISEGRFEILTGGWVMTDEANVDTFGMVDQLVEGHQWLRDNLNVTAKASWSVDPFGHGGTFPYILKSAGLDGMLIMRIHYAWKEWFAREQQGDFLWRQQWDAAGKHSILCHNFPYDIYSIKGSCGPHAQTCLEFNYRRVQGDYSEYSARYTPVHQGNVKERAELILEQYGKTGSLFPHNVVLAPLGDDFTYNHEIEFDQQYSNYKMLMDFINERSGEYNAEVTFGTLSDYFAEVRRRTSQFSTLNGDFFVYSDIFSEGRPAYWSGYFTTRPFMKALAREVQSQLRAAELLFTWCYQWSRQAANDAAANALGALYSSLVQARRHLALFQHHDAITGTSKQAVMHDYALKLWEALTSAQKIHRTAFQHLMLPEGTQEFAKASVFNDFERSGYQSPASPLPLRLSRPGARAAVLVFNPLLERVRQPVRVHVQSPSGDALCVEDADGRAVSARQVGPSWNAGGFFRLDVAVLELVFVAEMAPVSINKFVVSRCSREEAKPVEQTKVYCLRCPKNASNSSAAFVLSPKPDGAVQLENAETVLLFDEASHLLRTVTHKRSGRSMDVNLEFGAYPTAQFRSGAYLLKVNSRAGDAEKLAVFGKEDLVECVVTSGAVFSEVTLVFEAGVSKQEPGRFLHTVRLYHTNDGVLNRGVYVENNFDFGGAENHNDLDLFMRFSTAIQNGGEASPEFYTDMNGLQMQRRAVVRRLNVEGNYYPVSTAAFVEDAAARLTLLVDHAMGATSWQRGQLEVMVDRRSTFDDSRGMGEGVLDNRMTKHGYWLLFEPKQGEKDGASSLKLPSEVAMKLSRRLNNPAVHYVGQSPEHFRGRRAMVEEGDAKNPCAVHLLNLRTLSDPAHPDDGPSRSALAIVQSQGSQCAINPAPGCTPGKRGMALPFAEAKVKRAVRTTLTGVAELGKTSDVRADLSDLKLEPMTLESVRLHFQ